MILLTRHILRTKCLSVNYYIRVGSRRFVISVNVLTSPFVSSVVMNVNLKFVTHRIPDVPCFKSLAGENMRTLSAFVIMISPGSNLMLLSDKEFRRLEPSGC